MGRPALFLAGRPALSGTCRHPRSVSFLEATRLPSQTYDWAPATLELGGRYLMEVREKLPDPQAFAARFRQIEENVERVVRGKHKEIRLALVALIAEGHLLIEDVPGVGKTMLAKSIARSIDCSFRRIQFTPDLLPTDVTGVNVFSQETGDFEFKPGAIFANIVLGDEINRASPKTQSALLECMEERQVTVDTETHTLGTPFIVIATQNPIEHEGTYPLPEAQLDRFMLRLAIGYPSADVEVEILASHASGAPLDDIRPVSDARGRPRHDRGGPAGPCGARDQASTSSISSRRPAGTPTSTSARARGRRS